MERFNIWPPTLLTVSRLAHPDMLVEIEAEAVLPPSRLKNLK